MLHPTDRVAHATTFVTPVVEHWLEKPQRNEGINVLFTDTLNTFHLLLYDKGPLRQSKRKPAAATWAILSD